MATVKVDPGAVDRHGKTACEIAADLRSIRNTWSTATDDPTAAFGDPVLNAAYTGTQDAWFAELNVQLEIVDELCAKLRGAAGNYCRSDDRAERRL